MSFLVVLAILLVVVVFVTAPLRRAAASPAASGASARASAAEEVAHASAVAELEAAREAKLREITDADLDHRMGKLSDEDHHLLDATLRAEAVEILNRLDALSAPDPQPAG